MCQCELDLWPISPKLGHMTGSSYCINVPIVKFIDLCVFEICGHKIRFRGPVATGIAMATICGPLVEGGPRVIPQAWTSYDHPLLSYDTFLTEYVTWRCDLYLCPHDMESCHVTPLGWSTPIPSLKWIWLAGPEIGRIQCFLAPKNHFLSVNDV